MPDKELFALVVGFGQEIVASPQIGITESLFVDAAANQMIMYFKGVPIALGGRVIQEVMPGIWVIEICEAKRQMLDEFVRTRFSQAENQNPIYYIGSADAITTLRKAA